MQLVRQLSFMDIYLTSLDFIIGAGIYILIGRSAKYTDKQTWLAFMIAGIIAIVNSISYIELSHLFKKNGGEYEFISNTLGEIPGLMATVAIISMSVLTTTTIALGMGGFLENLFNVSKTKAAAFIILLYGIINMISLRFAVNITKVSAITETLGLILIILIGWKHIDMDKTIRIPENFYSIGRASLIAMFAYIGFETTIKMTEEAINPDRDIPLAIISSVLTATILYVFISMVATNVLNKNILQNSPTPIATLAGKLMNPTSYKIYSLITFISISGTILTSILGSSRMMYGVSEYYDIISPLRYVNDSTKTPIVSIGIMTILSIIALCIKNVEKAAVFTSCLFFLILILVNISLIYLHYDPKTKEKLNEVWSSKINKDFPITPVISIITSFVALSCNM